MDILLVCDGLAVCCLTDGVFAKSLLWLWVDSVELRKNNLVFPLKAGFCDC